VTAEESTARDFAGMLWATASVDASQATPEARQGVVAHLDPGKAPGAPTGPRPGAAER
jgi:hypothetical protein